jgi:hypothetical protein
VGVAASAIVAGTLLLAGLVPAAAAGSANGRPEHQIAAPGAPQTDVVRTAGGQTFDIRGWPGDTVWVAAVETGLGTQVQALEDLTGFSAPGGTISIVEVADGLNDYGIAYDPATRTLGIPQSAKPSVVAYALGRIWFNSTLLSDVWVREGLARFGEQVAGPGNYLPCTSVPAYPGIGKPDLVTWVVLDANSTIEQQNVSDWQVAASCAFFTAVAGAMGPANFRNVLSAVAARRPAYGGASNSPPAAQVAPVETGQLLDLIDEVGMVPAGVSDPDMAQKLLGGLGIFDQDLLALRSAARAAYRSLAARAGSWSLPPVIQDDMRRWDFTQAMAAASTAVAVLDLCAAIQKNVPSYSPSGSIIEQRFEAAATQSDLESLQTTARQLSDASGTISRATGLRDRGRSPLETIGLLGADLDTPLAHARAGLLSAQPARAQSDAQTAIDEIDGAAGVGELRVAVTVGILGLAAVAVFWVVLVLRKRRSRGSPIVEAAPAVDETSTPTADDDRPQSSA